MPSEPNPLTRKQKLLGERNVQLGNIAKSLEDRFNYSNKVLQLIGLLGGIEQSQEFLAGQLQDLETTLCCLQKQPAPSNSNIVVSATKPPDPSIGLIWFDLETLSAYVYNDDGDSRQWVEIR